MDQYCRFCSAESQSCGNLNWGQIPESVGIDMKLYLATLSLEESLKTLFVSGIVKILNIYTMLSCTQL